MRIEDGGPAFPQQIAKGEDGVWFVPELEFHFHAAGMSLLDYFAIHGPEPTAQQVDDYMTGWTKLDVRLARAQIRYLEAEAMLRARKNHTNAV